MTVERGAASRPDGPGRTSDARLSWILIGVLTLVGGALRLYHLGFKSLWLDESILYGVAAGPFSGLLARNALENSGPPLFPVLLHLALRFGDSEAILRSIAWIGGTLSIPAMYFLARQFLERVPAYVVALLVAFSPMQVRYSQEVREYSLTFGLAALMVALCLRFRRRPTVRRWAAMAAAFVVGFFLQYGLVVLAAALALVLAISAAADRGDRKRLAAGTAALILVCLAATLVVYEIAVKVQLVTQGRERAMSTGYLREESWHGTFSSLAKLAVVNSYGLVTATYPGELFLFLVALGVCWALVSRGERFALLLLGVPAAATFLLACVAFYPYGGGRHDMFLMPMILVFAGFGVTSMLHLPMRVAAIGLLAAILSFVGLRESRRLLEDPGPENMRLLVETLDSARKPGDRIYVYAFAVDAFRYYFRGRDTSGVVFGAERRRHPSEFARQVAEISDSPRRTWLVFTHCTGDDCELVEKSVAGRRRVEKIRGDEETWLSLAP